MNAKENEVAAELLGRIKASAGQNAELALKYAEAYKLLCQAVAVREGGEK